MAKHRKKSTRKMSRGALTTVVGLGVIAAGLPAAMQANAAPLDESAAAARTPIKVVQHNTDQIRSSFQKVVALGGTHDLLLAEEVCETWVKDVKAAHPAWTVSFHRQKITHRPTTEKPNQRLCAGDSKWKGVVAIHSGAGKASAQEFSFYGAGQSPDPDQDFGMACVKFTKGGTDVHGCATHLQVYGDKDMAHRTHQTGRIKQITDPWITKGDSAIVGGDFNAQPKSAPLTNMYQPGGTGSFIEAHQLKTGKTARAGADTVAGRKIDYIFFSSNKTPLKSGGQLVQVDTRRNKPSHLMMKATASLR